MKILNILRSEPDEMVQLLMKGVSEGNVSTEYKLYKEKPDYDHLVQEIFDSERTFSWW